MRSIFVNTTTDEDGIVSPNKTIPFLLDLRETVTIPVELGCPGGGGEKMGMLEVNGKSYDIFSSQEMQTLYVKFNKFGSSSIIITTLYGYGGGHIEKRSIGYFLGGFKYFLGCYASGIYFPAFH